MFEYIIETGLWKFTDSKFSTDILGVCISVDIPELYSVINPSTAIKEHIITLQKHGEPKIVKDCYLTYVDSPLRRFSDFYYIELYATQINCDNINKIISTSCLPVSYLENLVKENVKEYNV